MYKLLHERLRESGDSYSFLRDEYSQTYSGDKYMDWEYVANKLADEIERRYIPLPRFKDGEPVSKGCEVEGGQVEIILEQFSDRLTAIMERE